MRRMYGIPGRTGGAVVALAALAVGLAACGSSSSSTTTTTGAATTTTAASATTSTSGSTSTTRTSITGCASSGLAVTLGSANGTAGSVHYPIAFRNTTSSACTLYGFPGVSFLTAGGTQIGVPAQRESGVAFATITLAPNGLAYSSVGVTDPGIPPCTGSSTATQVRVFPPGETHAILVAAPSGIAVCSSPNTANYQSAIVTPMTASSL
ncbi:MAG TPA: DUF4232 domain-containing protein [Acidimicrobiales bacterium]